MEARVKRVFKQAYRQCWKNFLNKLDKNTPQSLIWQFIKEISNKNFFCKKTPISLDLIEEIFDHITRPAVSNLHFPNLSIDTTITGNTIDKPFDIMIMI